MERITNTIQLSAICKTPQEREEIHQQVRAVVGKKLKRVEKPDVPDDSRVEETYAPLYLITIKLYTQPEQRAFIEHLRSNMSPTQKHGLLVDAKRHIDHRLNFFFRLNKKQFLQGSCVQQLKGDVIQVRVNLSAHPKNEGNVLSKVAQMLG